LQVKKIRNQKIKNKTNKLELVVTQGSQISLAVRDENNKSDQFVKAFPKMIS